MGLFGSQELQLYRLNMADIDVSLLSDTDLSLACLEGRRALPGSEGIYGVHIFSVFDNLC